MQKNPYKKRNLAARKKMICLYIEKKNLGMRKCSVSDWAQYEGEWLDSPRGSLARRLLIVSQASLVTSSGLLLIIKNWFFSRVNCTLCSLTLGIICRPDLTASILSSALVLFKTCKQWSKQAYKMGAPHLFFNSQPQRSWRFIIESSSPNLHTVRAEKCALNYL